MSGYVEKGSAHQLPVLLPAGESVVAAPHCTNTEPSSASRDAPSRCRQWGGGAQRQGRAVERVHLGSDVPWCNAALLRIRWPKLSSTPDTPAHRAELKEVRRRLAADLLCSRADFAKKGPLSSRSPPSLYTFPLPSCLAAPALPREPPHRIDQHRSPALCFFSS